MPELPEVETIVRGLRDHLIGRTIRTVELVGVPVFDESPEVFCERLTGRTVEAIDRHGKAIFVALGSSREAARSLRIHLGMTGQLLWTPIQAPVASHTHVLFQLDHPTHHLRYRDIRRFGELSIVSRTEGTPHVPDAWQASDAEIERSLRGIRGMLKHALLSQKVVAGLGNIYVDEALFKAGLHPNRKGENLRRPQWTRLTRSIRRVLGCSIQLGGTSFQNYVDVHGGRGGFKGRLSVYGKTGSPCVACGAKIRRLVVAGRGTHICPRCQPCPR